MIKPLLLAITAFLVSACVYNNNDVYVNPIQPPTLANTGISLNSVNATDTIKINKPQGLLFNVYPLDKGQYNATVTIGNTSSNLSSTSGIFYFILDPALIGNGTKVLTIEATYPSLSPSLAGQLKIETIILTRQWLVTIDVIPPSPLPPPKVYLEDGKSMVSWTSPDRFTFSELIILRTYYNANHSVEHVDSIKVNDHHATIFHDASYLGGPVTYRVDLKGYKFYQAGGETSFNIKPINFSVDSLADPVVISWQKSPLYNNDIRISQPNVFPLSQPGSFPYDVSFGRTDGIQFNLQALNPPPSQVYSPYVYSVYVPITKGIKIQPFDVIRYLPSQNAYVMQTGVNTISIVDAITLKKTQELQVGFQNYLITSANGQHSYLYTASKLYVLNTNGLSLGQEIDLEGITGQVNHYFASTPVVSNDNIITFSFTNYSGPNKDYGIDLTSKQIVWQQAGPTNPIISSDSKYIFSNGTVFKNNADNWASLAGKITTTGNVAFRIGNVNQLIVNSYGGTKLFSLDMPPDGGGMLVPISFFPDTYTVSFDSYADQYYRISAYDSYSAKAFVYNPDTFQEERNLDQIISYSDLVFVNGHFFHRQGFYFP